MQEAVLLALQVAQLLVQIWQVPFTKLLPGKQLRQVAGALDEHCMQLLERVQEVQAALLR